MSENGTYPHEITNPEDWEYILSNPLLQYQMRPVCQGLYDMVVVRRKNGDALRNIFKAYPNLLGRRVQNPFSKEPNKDDVWLCRERTEDLIFSSSGETYLPKSMEGVIELCPFINAALIIERGEAGKALLAESEEAATCEEQKQKLLDDSWRSVQSTKEICPVRQGT
ncbi:hypothetical protein IMSHALPRED_004293 [Imshaugia aleurites]|uniref:Uncharacterized protein n=1 Tax=Imshaugia aleurites TaxID=172621 RepID=A0A8H3IH09_9LECA|nr:hypothetical protein IMSHALPRED_004293 [Imshaugia aleurites]